MKYLCGLCLLLWAVAGHAAADQGPDEKPPNVVFVFIDDMGYGDLGCYGSTDIRTPEIDRLAAQGLRFTQFYVASPICSPSRVGATTGRFPSRLGVHSYLAARKRNAARGMVDFLDPSVPTIARTFQSAGYATAHFGKWHMGGGRDVGEAPLPADYGFDESLVSFEGLGDRILPEGSGLGRQSEQLGRGSIEWVPKHRQTEIYIDRAIGFIERQRERPFYLQAWLNDVHDPFQPEPSLLEQYADRSENPYERQYLAVMEAMDRQIGRLIQAIDRAGLEERTIVVLSSDNGPTAWPKYYKEGHPPPGSTAGLRGRKWSLYEGGIREPLIVRWTGRVAPGTVNRDTVIGAVDLFPTLCALTGTPAPKLDQDSQWDGEDLSEVILGKSRQRSRPLIWEYGRDDSYLRPGLPHDQSPNLAIRDGRWKLLINADATRRELYDFSDSDQEESNVATEHPEVADRLAKQLLDWRHRLPVFRRTPDGATPATTDRQ